MPRQPRPDLAGVTQHVVQRGNDRRPCFFTMQGHGRYLLDLATAARRYGKKSVKYSLRARNKLSATPGLQGAAGVPKKAVTVDIVPDTMLHALRGG